jgi:hypothetical protein
LLYYITRTKVHFTCFLSTRKVPRFVSEPACEMSRAPTISPIRAERFGATECIRLLRCSHTSAYVTAYITAYISNRECRRLLRRSHTSAYVSNRECRRLLRRIRSIRHSIRHSIHQQQRVPSAVEAYSRGNCEARFSATKARGARALN